MYSRAASLNSVTEHGATALRSGQTLRVLTNEISKQAHRSTNDSIYRVDQASSGSIAPAGQASARSQQT